MKNISKEKLGVLIGIVLMIAGLLTFATFSDDKELKKEVVKQVTNTVTETVSDIVKYEMSEDEIKELPSTEIEEQTEEQENALEQEVENEAFELQGEIAYEGDRARSWNVELGDYKGLTYYSQIDNRWRYKMYSSIGDSTQTIGSSGCRTNICFNDCNSNKRNYNT
jgi:hypothetical protein